MRPTTVAFTSGCFDGLHAGHLHLLKTMRGLADFVHVGLNDDSYILRKKHRDPIHSMVLRRRALWQTNLVDMINAFSEDGPLKLILAIRPDFIVVGDDYEMDQIVGAKECGEWGGVVVRVPRLPGISTTEILAGRKVE